MRLATLVQAKEAISKTISEKSYATNTIRPNFKLIRVSVVGSCERNSSVVAAEMAHRWSNQQLSCTDCCCEYPAGDSAKTRLCDLYIWSKYNGELRGRVKRQRWKSTTLYLLVAMKRQ
jgi:hypothetical protein